MNRHNAKQTIGDMHSDVADDSIRSMLREFYSPRMRATAAIIWAVGLAFLALAIYSAVEFFRAVDTKHEIMFATVFICCFNGMGLMKVFGWQMLHRNSIKQAIRRLELRLVEPARS